MKLTCLFLLLPVLVTGQSLLSPIDGKSTIHAHPHLEWEQSICTPVDAMPETEVQIARDPKFCDIVDRDSVAAVIRRYVPAKALEPGKYFWRIRHVPAGKPPYPWTKPSSFEVYLPETTFHVPRGTNREDIQQILAMAKASSPARVLFEKGEWKAFPGEVLLGLDDCHGLLIDGNGSTFGLMGYGSFAEFYRSSEIHIKGFTIEYLDYGHLAGKIVAKDKDKFTIDFQLLPGYPTLEEMPVLADYPEGTIRSSGRSGVKDRSLWHARTKLGFQNLGERTYRLEVEKEDFDAFELGDTYFKGPRWSPGFHIHTCNDVTISNIQMYMCQGRSVETARSNRVKILDFEVKRKEGKPMATPAKAQYHLNAKIGPWVENCLVENTVRDVCQVSGRAFPVRKILAPNRLLLGAYPTVKPGETLQFFDREKGEVLSVSKVTAVKNQGWQNVMVSLEKPVGNIRTGEGWSTETKATLAFNMDRQGGSLFGGTTSATISK